jgi:hypothetical protein
MNAFRASENCDAFIVFRSFPSQEKSPENSKQNWSSLKGSEQRPDQLSVEINTGCLLSWNSDRREIRAWIMGD